MATYFVPMQVEFIGHDDGALDVAFAFDDCPVCGEKHSGTVRLSDEDQRGYASGFGRYLEIRHGIDTIFDGHREGSDSSWNLHTYPPTVESRALVERTYD